jgi:hypothetical protein
LPLIFGGKCQEILYGPLISYGAGKAAALFDLDNQIDSLAADLIR